MTQSTQAHVELAHRHEFANVVVGFVVEHYSRILLADKVWYGEKRRTDSHNHGTWKKFGV